MTLSLLCMRLFLEAEKVLSKICLLDERLLLRPETSENVRKLSRIMLALVEPKNHVLDIFRKFSGILAKSD